MIPSEKKLFADLESFQDHIENLARPVVFTNGCFDLLHRGHVDYLEQAAQMGKTLVVGVNSDRSIRNLGKGDDRPYNLQEDRMAVIAGLASVDFVVGFDDETPISLIEAITPDLLIKGGDWEVEHIVGAEWVKQHGGRVESIPFRFDRSTTALADRIKAFHNMFSNNSV